MKLNLTSEERESLIKIYREKHNGKDRDRIRTVLAYHDGLSYSEIAKILILDENTIHGYIDDYIDKKELKLSRSPEKIGENLRHLETKFTYRYLVYK